MKKYKALKNHICRFNDGEQKCGCFDEGYRKAIKDFRKILNDNFWEVDRNLINFDLRELFKVEEKEVKKGKKFIKIDKKAFKNMKYQVSIDIAKGKDSTIIHRHSDIRSGGLKEMICPHGIGHHRGTHGCDGCCGLPEYQELMLKTTEEKR